MRLNRRSSFALQRASGGGHHHRRGTHMPSPPSGARARWQPQPREGIPDSYIVTVRRGADARAGRRSARRFDRRVYSLLGGFAAQLTPDQLTDVRADDNVVAVEADQVVHADTTQNVGSTTWGIDRLDQRLLPLSKTYRTRLRVRRHRLHHRHRAAAQPLTVRHARRVVVRRSRRHRRRLQRPRHPCRRHHRRHVPTGLPSRSSSVRPCTRLRRRRHDVQRHRRPRLRAQPSLGPAVANLSLSGSKSTALNDAVKMLVASGVAVSVAAGNEGTSACTKSPAGATRRTRRRGHRQDRPSRVVLQLRLVC